MMKNIKAQICISVCLLQIIMNVVWIMVAALLSVCRLHKAPSVCVP